MYWSDYGPQLSGVRPNCPCHCLQIHKMKWLGYHLFRDFGNLTERYPRGFKSYEMVKPQMWRVLRNTWPIYLNGNNDNFPSFLLYPPFLLLYFLSTLLSFGINEENSKGCQSEGVILLHHPSQCILI